VKHEIDLEVSAMYIHRMVRTQLYLDEAMHERLRELADRQGRTVSDLVREAVSRAFGSTGADERLAATLKGITGLWQDREHLDATDAYVRRLRRDTRRSRPPR
jgi:hypothetical protein